MEAGPSVPWTAGGGPLRLPAAAAGGGVGGGSLMTWMMPPLTRQCYQRQLKLIIGRPGLDTADPAIQNTAPRRVPDPVYAVTLSTRL